MMPGSETFSPFINADIRVPFFFSADVLKKCALLSLHLIAEEGRGAGGCYAQGLGDEWKMGCPKSPMWESEGEAWSEDESVSSSGFREGNGTSLGCMRSLFSCRIGAGKGGFKLPHGPGHAMQGNE